MGSDVIYREIDISPGRRISKLKYALLLLLIALLGAGAFYLSQEASYYILNSFNLSLYLSTIVSAVVVSVGFVYLNRYLISHGIRIPVMRRIINQRILISPGSGQPVDEELIRRYERALESLDKGSEGYVAALVMLGAMYLQNAVAYGNRDFYLKANEYLAKARDAMQEVKLSGEVKLLVDNLGNWIEAYKRRFEE